MSDDLKNVIEQALQNNTTLQELSRVVETEVSRHVLDGSMTLAEACSKLEALATDSLLQNILYQEEDGQEPKLNPLLVAEVMERLQFDGDAPELRAGHMLEGGSPAVPVSTEAVDSVFVGMLLEKASEEVAQEFQRNAAFLVQSMPEVEKALTADVSAEESVDALVPRVYENAQVDPAGYHRGQLPALRTVEKSTEILHVSAHKKQQLSWKALVTTQGRRSSLQPIESYLLRELKTRGLDIDLGVGTGDPLAQGVWVTTVSGPLSMQVNFSPIVVARAVILHKILQQHKENPLQGSLLLHVRSVDTISERVVGWSAQIYGVR